MPISDDSTPPYAPSNGYRDTGGPAPSKHFTHGPRRGPLSARLEAHARNTPPPESGPLAESALDGVWTDATSGVDRVTGAPISEDESPAWSTFTQVMREPSGSEEALRARHEFTVRWNNRSDMLGACLDEYYKLTASINEARKLLQDTERDITTLRQHQFTAFMTLREVEMRLEMHSRTELRAAYMGAAEIEMRVFRCEQDRDMLTGRIEMLDGFMQFLSRVIATIRGIAPSEMTQSTGAPDSGAATPAAAPEDADSLYEELVVDADEAEAMIASGEVEVLGMVEEDHATVAPSMEIRATPDVNGRNMPA